MNTPANDQDNHDEWNEPLKSLKPRAPRLDWDAIQAAHADACTATTSLRPASAAAPLRVGPAVAWWSGLAAGAAITFLAMQWLVLNDLRSRLDLLEQSARRSTSNTTKIQPSLESKPSGIVQAVDFHDLLDRTNLTVGSVRGSQNRLIHAHASSSESDRSSSHTNVPSASTSDDLPVRVEGEIAPEVSSVNRLLLLRELKQAVH
jgi:hypothetical protein